MIRILILLLVTTVFPRGVSGEPVRVMVAANFKDCLTELADRYTAKTGQEVLLSSGATGMLFAQISAGAPCHLFFAADEQRPQQLVNAGLAIAESRVTYATGRLVLWSPHTTVATDDVNTALSSVQLVAGQHIAIANPLHAPYGAAARQTLVAAGQWETLQPHLVLGQSAGQTWQFIYTGAARLGFVSLAHIRAAQKTKPGNELGQILVVPAVMHDPIDQQVVMLRDAPPAARHFLNFVGSEEAADALREFGYEVPD